MHVSPKVMLTRLTLASYGLPFAGFNYTVNIGSVNVFTITAGGRNEEGRPLTERPPAFTVTFAGVRVNPTTLTRQHVRWR